MTRAEAGQRTWTDLAFLALVIGFYLTVLAGAILVMLL